MGRLEQDGRSTFSARSYEVCLTFEYTKDTHTHKPTSHYEKEISTEYNQGSYDWNGQTQEVERSMKLRMWGAERGTASVEWVCYSRGSHASQVVMSRKLRGCAKYSVTAVGGQVVRPSWVAQSTGGQIWRRNVYFKWKIRFSALCKLKWPTEYQEIL